MKAQRISGVLRVSNGYRGYAVTLGKREPHAPACIVIAETPELAAEFAEAVYGDKVTVDEKLAQEVVVMSAAVVVG